ncbi:GspE/PulE family protein [Noviherbaspirillum galbum]|uniref:Type II/IV secretion system protein n=1 Tax=Noviherbaspirillum galbum TaxID=2709383 RepID=A0A6B3SRX8_9BURK|nr:GspE/PulE family protein [Noviherbaspirillum galbum]NEX63401.1 type II/IV secretion system protein [Noviherbaspirillum galbum]
MDESSYDYNPVSDFSSILVPEDGYAYVDGLDEFISTDRGDTEVVYFLNHVFPQALHEGASDIHFIHHVKGFRVRFRINGVLEDRYFLNSEAARDLDLKIRSRCMLATSEREAPLDGSFFMLIDGRRVDVRVSILPNSLGQSIVCRLLDQNNAGRTLDSIWMPDAVREVLLQTLALEEGLILNVGPTGSGKTSTLYACLNHLNRPGIHICTVEDPVEYSLPGANQVTVRAPERTFAKVLRSFLRQDFDVGLVGEIRDAETANIALAAANTGHLMLSTLHTRSTLATVSRLADLGVKHYELADTIRLIVAQRLLKRLCPHCSMPYEMDDLERDALAAEEGGHLVDTYGQYWVANPDGCDACEGGYIGRVPVMEMLAGTRELKAAIESTDRATMVKRAYEQHQYQPLIVAGTVMSANRLVDFHAALKINM